MNRRMFAKALASVAGALKAKEVLTEAPPSPLNLDLKGLPVPSDWGLDQSDPPSDYPSTPDFQSSDPFFHGRGWRRSPSDPPISLAEQASLREYGRNKSHDNSDRFSPYTTHPIGKAKNYFSDRYKHNQYPRYASRTLFREHNGNPVESWVKERRAHRISLTLKELKKDIKDIRKDLR